MEIISEILSALDNIDIRNGLERSVLNFSPKPFKILDKYSYLDEFSKCLQEIKSKVFRDIEYYIDKTIKAVEDAKGHGYYVRDKDKLLKLVDEIIGDPQKLIVKAKSMVTEEVDLRGFLMKKGHKVYETDLGEFLIQLAGEKPMHTIAPAIHMTRERARTLLSKAGINIKPTSNIEEMVGGVRNFIRDKFIKADIGITGANVVSADTGSIFLVSNEGNIRNTSSLPLVHIAITGIEKILPTMKDAFIQILVQSANAGLYPPTYVSVISGPSSTADIEFYRVIGVHGPKELHLILYDGGRIKALNDAILHKQLYCIKCGRCQIECPIWDLVGNIWGGSVYGGPMGIGWTAITEDRSKASMLATLCLNCARCSAVCPMEIDLHNIILNLKREYIESLIK